MKKKMVTIMFVLLVLFIVPVFAKGTVSIEKLTGATDNKEVVLNATDKLDVSFNELKQNATYKVELKNTTEDILYVNDLTVENLSESFIDFSLTDKSFNAALEPGTTKEIEFVVSTLDITGAGRNVNDEVKLMFVLGDSIKNPVTSSELLVLCILILILFVTGTFTFKRIRKKIKMTVLIIGLLLVGTTYVYAKEVVRVELTGKVSYISQNLMQESGTELDKYRINYINSVDIWKHSNEIKNIVISDDKMRIEDYDHKYDLSIDNSKRILGYVIKNGDTKTPYDLYIVADGIIYAPANSTGLFSFPNVEKISGLEFVEFENTTNMAAMFMGNQKLSDVNIKSINTSNVVNTSYMFNDCDKLDVTENTLDLTNVTNKNFMFSQDLSNVVRLNAQTDSSINFSTTPVAGKYIIDNTKDDTNPIYYYRGNVSDNNVLFGGYCWKMVRTTDTGGIKLIYNGLPSVGYTLVNSSQYVNVTNNSSNKFSFNNITSEWTSSNKKNSSSSVITFNVAVSGNYAIKYTVSSEKNYDWAWFYKDDVLLAKVSGSKSETINLGYILPSTKLQVKYSKDFSVSSGNDSVKFSIVSDDHSKTVCNNSGINSEIGKSIYNSNRNSMAYVGYMYNSIYENEYISQSSDSYVFGKNIEWIGSKYVLVDTIVSNNWYSDANSISTDYKYTCLNDTGECTSVKHVVAIGSSQLYYVDISNGNNINDVKSLQFENVKNSVIKDKIDNWYEMSLIPFEDMLEDTVWVNDRQFVAGVLASNNTAGNSINLFAPNSRNQQNFLPSLNINNINDKFTVSSSKGNGSLRYPIGLLTADEITLAGSGSKGYSSSSYLNTGSSWWTLSPYNCGANSLIYLVNSSGKLSNNFPNENSGVRPSVSLIKDINYVYGTGTVTDPYIVE